MGGQFGTPLDLFAAAVDERTDLAGRFGAVGAAANDAFGARRIPVNIHRHSPGRGPLS